MASAPDYTEFNNFQYAFYTNISKFENYSNFEIKRNGYVLLNNLAKGFPALAEILINSKGIGWKGVESPALLKALQRKFINNFNSVKVPGFIYYKNLKEEKIKQPKVKETKLGYVFDMDIQNQICSILKIDSKTYDYLKFSKSLQYLGLQLNGEFMQKEKIKKGRKKNK